jgi:hypothetical protein
MSIIFLHHHLSSSLPLPRTPDYYLLHAYIQPQTDRLRESSFSLTPFYLLRLLLCSSWCSFVTAPISFFCTGEGSLHQRSSKKPHQLYIPPPPDNTEISFKEEEAVKDLFASLSLSLSADNSSPLHNPLMATPTAASRKLAAAAAAFTHQRRRTKKRLTAAKLCPSVCL